MDGNTTINLAFVNNNYVGQNQEASQHLRQRRDVSMYTRRVAILNSDSEVMVAFKQFMNQFPELVPRVTGEPNKKSTACPICDIKSSTAWRSGPDGKKLCNACGLQFANFKKEMLEQQQQAQERVREKMSLSYILN